MCGVVLMRVEFGGVLMQVSTYLAPNKFSVSVGPTRAN